MNMINKSQKLVTVIAVCYNHEKYLIETLDSIVNQTYKNIQLIIMDDFSTDNSVNIINKWIIDNKVKCQFLAHTKNQGVCKTLNEALEIAVGDYIQLISCDDVLLKSKLSLQVSKFDELDKSYGVIYSDADFIDEFSKDLNIKFTAHYTKDRNFKKLSGNIFNNLITGNYLAAMSTLIKKEVLEKIGNYDEDLDYEDYDFWLRAAKKFNFYYTNESLVKYRMHSENLHKKISSKMADKNLIFIALKHRENPFFFDKIQRGIFDEFYTGNDRNFINKFYSLIHPKNLNKTLAHYFIKYNLPSVLVKIASRV